MRRRILQVSFGTLGVILLCGLTVLGLIQGVIQNYKPPGNWANPPLYPGARDVRVQDFGESGKLDPAAASVADTVHIMKIITFTVADQPQNIESFYADDFENSGWELSTWGRVVEDPRLNYSWTSGGRSPSVYFVDIITTPADSGETNVEIGVSMFPGY